MRWFKENWVKLIIVGMFIAGMYLYDYPALFCLMILPALIYIYLLPTIICQNPRSRGSIFVVNLFLGWTLIGWVFCLSWAFYQPREIVR